MSAMNLLQSIFGSNLPTSPQSHIPHQTFARQYYAFPPSYWNSEQRDILESGDKIIMPPSALQELSRMAVEFPITFEIAHDSDIIPKKSHCGVLEFTAPESRVYLPLWMIDHLGLDPLGYSEVILTNISLPKGTFAKFQPHETKFTLLSNPRVVLEKRLRSYSCLTVGQPIHVKFANYIYKLDVIEVKPSISRSDAPPAILIIETDLKVDFMRPRDYDTTQQKNIIQIDVKEEEEKKEAFEWKLALSEYEKCLLISGYVRMSYNEYMPHEIIQLFMLYSNYSAKLDDIKNCRAYTRFESNIFDVFGTKFYFQLLPNGDPDNKHNDDKQATSGPNILTTQNVLGVVQERGDNSCVLLSAKQTELLGLFRGDSVLLKGTRRHIAIVLVNELTEDGHIRMNETALNNIGCQYGDTISVGNAGNIGYGKSMRLAPIKESEGLKWNKERTFGATAFNMELREISLPQTAAETLFKDYVKPYFVDTYRPCIIGDIYAIYDTSNQNCIEFEVIDFEMEDRDSDHYDYGCIVAPETIIYIDEPIEKNRKIYIDRPVLKLCLKDLPSNIKNATMEFDIIIKEIQHKHSASFTFSMRENQREFIWRQPKVFYIKKLKDFDQLRFGLELKSIALKDLNDNKVNMEEFKINQQKKTEIVQQTKATQIIKQQDNESKTDDNAIQELQVKDLSLQEEKQNNQTQRNEFQTTIDDLLKEQTKLNKKNEQLLSEVNKLTDQVSMLNKENANLNEECKEYQLQLADIKSKYDKLYRKHNIDLKNYKNWNDETIADWIISLDDGAYEMYESSLRLKMKEESMSGAFLHELDKNDLDRFGIKSFAHKSSIMKHIQKLISQQNKNNEGPNVTEYH